MNLEPVIELPADNTEQRRLLNAASKWMTDRGAEWVDLCRSDYGRQLGIRPTKSPHTWVWPQTTLTIIDVP